MEAQNANKEESNTTIESGNVQDTNALQETKRKVGIVFDEKMMLHKSKGGHPERPERIMSIYEELKKQGLLSKCTEVPCRPATDEELLTVHPQPHIDLVKETKQKVIDREGNPYFFTADTYANEHSSDAALLAVGGLLDLVDKTMKSELDGGFAIIRPPGHHCEASKAMGFCLYNNVAVAAGVAKKVFGAKKIVIVDWDVHHGNGTEEIFIEDPSVLYFSVHRHDFKQFYPGTGLVNEYGEKDGKGFNVNVPWEGEDKGDSEYIAVFTRILAPIVTEYAPDLILVSAGFDCARGDPLGRLDVTPAGFANMMEIVMSLCPKVVVALEGGYNLESISKSAAECVKVLLGEKAPKHEERELNKSAASTINKVIGLQKEFWSSLRDDQEEVIEVTQTLATLTVVETTTVNVPTNQ